MEAYAGILLYAIPGFLIIIVFEAMYSYFKGKLSFNLMDTISSLSSGGTNILKSVLGLSVIIISYDWVYHRIAILNIETNWLVYLVAFICIDFAGYWSHRLAHSVNLFWNGHVIHHSGEEFNTATALRQEISGLVSLAFIFLFPAALLGVPPKVIGTIAPLHLFMQFWYHTEHIGKLGFLEYIIVTPSQHRVHHAINSIYLDKNLSPIFCIWDRLFGTFQEELEEEPCVYGVTRQVNTWNPIKINFQHLWLLIQDAWRTNSIWDKFRIWFMPTGWRPEDVKAKYPIQTADQNNFIKYDSNPSAMIRIWVVVQFLLMLFLLLHLLSNVGDLSPLYLFTYGAYLFIHVYSYTSLMDKDSNVIWLETIKSIIGLSLVWIIGDWFQIDETVPFGTSIIIVYHMVSVVVVFWIFFIHKLSGQYSKQLPTR